MKKFAKLLAIVMVFAVMIGMGTVAFAAEGEDADNLFANGAITINKLYKLIGEGTSPEETFTVEIGDGTISGRDVANGETAPTLGTITGADFDEGAATANGATGTISIAIPDGTFTKIGVYEYPLNEAIPDVPTPGVTYDETQYTLRVVVVNADPENIGEVEIAGAYLVKGEEKADTIENTYSAGTLEISKTVTGELGDPDKYFEFTVTIGNDTSVAYPVKTGSAPGVESGTALTEVHSGDKIYLKHGQTFTILNIPYNTEFSVVETAATGYTTAIVDNSGDETDDGQGTIAAASQSVAFTNDCTTPPPTGIDLDSVPYIVMLAVVALGVVAFVAKRRSAR